MQSTKTKMTKTSSNNDTPCSVGSLERFIAIILENTNGWLPLFVTPIQLAILPVSEKFVDHSNQIKEELKNMV